MFPDLMLHPEYKRNQTKAWCDQLAAKTGKYEFPWRTVPDGRTAEDIFTDKLGKAIRGKVLDVGCGHGDFTSRWADLADELVGFDITAGFIATANRNRPPNVRYVVGNTHDGLPFSDDAFDVAYTKKGPTSWYAEGNRVVRPGGALLMLHPGDGLGAELARCFPGLLPQPEPGTPIRDTALERLAASGLVDIEWSVLEEAGWLPTPEDVWELACFGQSEGFSRYVRETCFERIVDQFASHAVYGKGIRTTGSFYFVQAKAASVK
ncbi:class I SAM-dependent methyltransferase [Cohnella zeiphila]|uniref:Class I SAM-dependent methyltransferase n=1 Tax=Cohnella zeiphila TaxID=2761120 RepID=A0A7X0VWV7_9BACL|nr:class I SAM-dependent methyltransferase [Cohnella zeiphila]MBB6732910.1 class I SAM-dependent methyltransferase [Cohnella zeiphila]